MLNYNGISEDELQELLSFQCAEADGTMLTEDVTREEVTKILFAMPRNESPGHDGYTCEFFKST